MASTCYFLKSIESLSQLENSLVKSGDRERSKLVNLNFRETWLVERFTYISFGRATKGVYEHVKDNTEGALIIIESSPTSWPNLEIC